MLEINGMLGMDFMKKVGVVVNLDEMKVTRGNNPMFGASVAVEAAMNKKGKNCTN